MASEGVNLLLVARNEAKLLELKSQLAKDVQCQILALDLGDLQNLRLQVEAFVQKNGPIEILINNSGGPKSGPLLSANPEDFLLGFQSHILAAHTLAQILVPGMKQKKYGRIINIISTSVKIPIPNLGVSNTIRGAMASWSKTLANEVGEWGITVNNILPGFTATERLESLKIAAAERLNKEPHTVEEMWLNTIPAKRLAQPEEIAQSLLFLTSPAASYINGINLTVDGGRTGCL